MKLNRLSKILLLVLALALLGVGGAFTARHFYRQARQVRLLKQARDYIARPNTKRALLCLQRVLRYDPKNVEASRLMAQLSELSGSPAALIWRSRVVELAPASFEDRLALAQTAISQRDYPAATNTLAGVSREKQNTAAFCNVSGTVAAAAGLSLEAERHFLEALRLDPQNSAIQLNLSVVRLHGTNAQLQTQSRQALRQIATGATNSSLRYQAVRELTVDGLRTRQTNETLALAQALVRDTNSVMTDRLLHLEALGSFQRPEFKPVLASYQREAATNAAALSQLATWQMGKVGPADTLAWLRSLPGEVRTNQPAVMLSAECCIMVKDWRGLQAVVEGPSWAELEFVRRAFRALALREQNLANAAKGEWEVALKAANNQLGALNMLLRFAANWNWQTEAEELLWTIVNNHPSEKWASQALTQALFINGRTRSLLQLFSLQLKRSPADLPAKNDLAMTALLLEAKELKPHDLAAEVYRQSPTNASFASTYAFSLYLQNKPAEAQKVIETLSPTELQKPSISGYYGLILKATGNAAKAKSFLDAAAKAQVLPEEKRLFERARAGA